MDFIVFILFFFSYQAKDVAAVASWKSLVSVQLDTLLRDNADLRLVLSLMINLLKFLYILICVMSLWYELTILKLVQMIRGYW